ncbi:MAG: hypothetical protein AB4911_19570 [Oscillochloridaceae bacterium umkhey_bin13]
MGRGKLVSRGKTIVDPGELRAEYRPSIVGYILLFGLLAAFFGAGTWIGATSVRSSWFEIAFFGLFTMSWVIFGVWGLLHMPWHILTVR